MDPITALVIIAIAAGAGVGGYYTYEHYIKPGSTTASTPSGGTSLGGTAFADARCQGEYNAAPPETKTQLDLAFKSASSVGGSAGAAILQAAANAIRPAYPTLADCVAAAATKMAGGVAPPQIPLPTTQPAPTSAIPTSTIPTPGMAPMIPTPTASGSGATFFTDNCLDTYKALAASDQAVVDGAIDAANRAGGGSAGASILAAAAIPYTESNPNLYGCITAAAVAMNGGTMPDVTGAPSLPGGFTLPGALNALKTAGGLPLAMAHPFSRRRRWTY